MINGLNPSMRVGVGRKDLTPPLGTRLAGYAIPDRVAETIVDPLHATTLVFEDGEVRAALISLDWLMVMDDDIARFRGAIESATGIPAANITICSTQTHCAPLTFQAWGWGDKDDAYIAASLPCIIASVVAAQLALQPALVGIASVVSDVGINRREIDRHNNVSLGFNPWGPYDPEMTVVRFVGEQGTIASLIHYGAHPTAMGPLRVVSRDWPGVMIDRVEKLTGAPALFMNGAVGDVAPRTNLHAAVGDGIPAVQEVGYRAASHALQAFKAITELRCLSLVVHTETIVLPHAPLTDLAEAKRKLTEAEAGHENGLPVLTGLKHWQAVIQAHAQPRQASRSFQQTITRIGPVVLVPFAGEPFAEVVLRLRQRSPFQYTLCLSTTNGTHGYFVTRESRVRGGYEVRVAMAYGAYLLCDTIDDVLVAENGRLLDDLSQRSAS